jgi:hypothetical protein
MIRTKYKQMCTRNAVRALALIGLVLLGFISSGGTAWAETFEVDDVVSDTGDDSPGDGVCQVDIGSPCTLRAAIEESNAFTGTDTIVFDPDLSFTAPLAQTDSYTVTDSVTIQGPTTATLTIDAVGNHRHLFVGTSLITVTIANLTLIGGSPVFDFETGGSGGSIFFTSTSGGSSTLNLDSVGIQDSTSISDGGAILIFGELSIPSVNLTNVTLSNNVAGGNGGAIMILNGDVNILNSTISGNNATGSGGAIQNSVSDFSTLEVQNSTIVGNSAGSISGGIYNVAGCCDNAVLLIGSTILAGNVVLPTTDSDCNSSGSPFDSFGFNLTNNLVEAGCNYGPSDQRIAPANIFTVVVDPNLADNGGATPTHALLPNSPAINTVGVSSCPPPFTDQRGVPRPLGTACDVGAYEANVPAIAVTKTVGVIDGACASTSSIAVNQNTNVFYCVTIVNTGNVTLTSHGLNDPILGVNQPLPIELAPGATLSLTNNDISGFGPRVVTGDIANTVTVTSTDGITTTTAAASATVHVPSIAITKTVGTAPTGCAATSDIEVNAGSDVFYCVTIRNTGTTTLTSHAIQDPQLIATGVTVPFVLTPGAVVQVNNALLTSLGLPPVLGPRMVIDDTTNTATVTSTAETAGATAAGVASATVRVRELAICMVGNGVGTDTDVIRTITATVFITPTASLAHCDGSTPGASPQNPVSGVNVGFEVTGGTTVGPNFQTTNAQGQAIFSYRSVAPPEDAEQATTAANRPNAPADTDVIRVWADLDEGLDFDNNEPQDMEAVLTVVTLASFSAVRNNDGTVTVFWRTAAETDNAGFNLYRSPLRDGLYVKVNDSLIAGQGTGSGNSYHYVDEAATGGSLYYKLEDVDTSGVRTLHGPVEVVDQSPTYLPNINTHP